MTRRPAITRSPKSSRGQNWDPALRSPLTEIGVNVKEGDYILAVNGQPTSEMPDIYEALVGTAGKQVTLKVNGTAAAQGARDAVVVPTQDERSLYYYDWVQGNIAKVDEGDRRQGRLHPRPRHGRAGPERVRQALLSADCARRR